MTGIVLGVAMMMVSSTGVSPAPELSSATVAPPAVFTFDLPAATPEAPRWRRGTSAPAPSRPAKRFSPTDRIIAVAAGVAVGWVVGANIGGRLTESSNPDDDTSVLKGIFIGAPIGSVAGAILGWRLTR